MAESWYAKKPTGGDEECCGALQRSPRALSSHSPGRSQGMEPKRARSPVKCKLARRSLLELDGTALSKYLMLSYSNAHTEQHQI